MNRKLLFLINPHAGKAEIKAKALEVIDLFVANGYEVTVHTTQRRLEIPEVLAQRGAEFDLVVCSGGDGTLNETVTGLLTLPKRLPLGYIPAGTVNDFASSLRIPKNITQAAQLAITGDPFLCDVGAFEERCFTYIAAFGAFTDVPYQTPQLSKNLLGRAAYFLEGIKRLPLIKDYHLSVSHDGETLEGDFLFGMVSNSTSIGGFRMNEQFGRMNDGLLEVVLIRRPASAIETQQILSAVIRQEFTSEYICAFRTAELTVNCAEEVPWTLDGEFGGMRQHAVIRNLPHAITILCDPPDDKEWMLK